MFGVVWLASPPATPPLYDGLGIPDEPYRYVSPPAGYRHTAAPTGSLFTYPITGSNAMVALVSKEQGPQVQIVIAESALKAPSGATTMTLRVTPLAPTNQPPDGTIRSNVYRFTAETDHGQATADSDPNNLVVLRAPTAPPPAWVIEYDSGSGWQRLNTSRTGNDVYQAPLAGIGNYAIVEPSPGATNGASAGSTAGATKSDSGKGSALLPLLIVGLLLAVFIWAVLTIRYLRLRRARETPQSGSSGT